MKPLVPLYDMRTSKRTFEEKTELALSSSITGVVGMATGAVIALIASENYPELFIPLSSVSGGMVGVYFMANFGEKVENIIYS